MSDRLDADLTDLATCPYCGHVDRNCWEYGDDDQAQCPSCGEDFNFERVVTIRYRTWKDKP